MPKSLEQIRARVAEIAEELEALRGGQLTDLEARARLDDYVDRQAARVNVAATVASATIGSQWIKEPFVDAASLAPEQSAFALACWLDTDAVKQRLHKELAAVSGELCSELSEDDRAKRRRKLEDELAKLECDEEAAVETLEAKTGAMIPRRRDADPAVYLAADDDSEPEAA